MESNHLFAMLLNPHPHPLSLSFPHCKMGLVIGLPPLVAVRIGRDPASQAFMTMPDT